MKKFLKIVWGIFAVIGILFVAGYIGLRLKMGKFDISIYPTFEAQLDEYVDRLRSSGPFEKDTVSFEMTIIQDSVRPRKSFITGRRSGRGSKISPMREH